MRHEWVQLTKTRIDSLITEVLNASIHNSQFTPIESIRIQAVHSQLTQFESIVLMIYFDLIKTKIVISNGS